MISPSTSSSYHQGFELKVCTFRQETAAGSPRDTEVLERHTGNLPDGDRLFVTWLRRILTGHRFQIIRTRDVVAILEELTGKPWRPWFEKYVLGSEMPKVE